MTRGQVKTIFAVLGILVLAYAVTRLLGGGDGPPGGGLDLGARVEADVERISVQGGGTGPAVTLEREDGTWTVNGYPADTARVRQAIAGLDTARATRLVARSSANHARLGVADDSSCLVEIGPAAEPALRFHLGGRGREGRYVRLAGDDAVYVMPEAAVGFLDREAEDWRDRLIASLDTAVVSRIVVGRSDADREVVLVRAPADTADSTAATTWAEDGRIADSAVVRRLLEEVAGLRADGFPSDSVAFAADFEEPVAVLDLYASERVGAPPELSLLFLTAPASREFLVRRVDDPLVYVVSETRAEDLLPPAERLFPEAP